MPLIPMPKEARISEGSFTLDKETSLVVDAGFSAETTIFNQFLLKYYNLALPVSSKVKGKSIIVRKSGADLKPGGYSLEIAKKKIVISASEPTGVFYAFQTLIQLLPADGSKAQLRCLTIHDEPKFAWRGLHLDVCRHFFPPEFVKKYIDFIAMYKMNTFHWHLTEDQGWRIEIKRYPRLTSKGAWRKGTMVGPYDDHKVDSIPYGGFYTQDEIRDIVAYATQRHITIIPEIEMPGHALAALTAYPELSCTGGPFEVATTWGVFDDVYCPKEETFTFLENVLTEVIDLFPSQYIHIGGDECPKTRWKTCPHCQALIQKENLGDEHGLQTYFINRIEKFLNSKGRKIIGWDEILENGLAPSAAIMSWRGSEGGIAAARQQHFVVMTPEPYCYFDHYQADPKNEPLAIGGFTPLEKVYSYNPIPETLTAAESKYILGAQANMWSEYLPSTDQVEYMLFPRIAALAEVVWGTSEPADFDGFHKRLLEHFKLLDELGVNYRKPQPGDTGQMQKTNQ
jgi:hexosaminidase